MEKDYLLTNEISDEYRVVNVNLFCRFLVKIFVGFWQS